MFALKFTSKFHLLRELSYSGYCYEPEEYVGEKELEDFLVMRIRLPKWEAWIGGLVFQG